LKVSIITACFNSAETIAATIASVKGQDYINIEHLIIDGNSMDATVDIIKQNAPNCIIHSERDNGIYDAMNKGIILSTGDIVGILNSDDFYANSSIISKVVELFEQVNCDAVYGDLVYVDANDTNRVTRKWISGKFSKQKFLYGWMPPHPTFFVKKEVYLKYGLFNLNVYTAADYELMLRLLFKFNIKVAYLQEILVKMRAGGASNISLKNRFLANKGDRLAWKINNLKPFWFTLFFKPLRKIVQFIYK
jgi:glycosyltransferase